MLLKDKETVDATKELVKECGEVPEVKSKTEKELLDKNNYLDLTKPELIKLVNSLKAKNTQLDTITKNSFKEMDRLRALNTANLRLTEDTLTYIRTLISNTYASVNLAIKNMEREVKQ